MLPLFRKEAIQANCKGTNGSVVISAGPVVDRLIGLILVCVIGLLLVSFYVDYPRLVSVDGTLKASQGSVKMYLDKPLIIEQVLISDNDIVSKDQALAIVRLNPLQAKVNSNRQQQLQQQVAQINRSTELQTIEYESFVAHIQQQIVILKNEINNSNQSLQIQNQLVGFKHRQLQKIKQLSSKGSASNSQYDHANEQYLSAKLQMQKLTLELQQRQSQIVNFNNQLNSSTTRHNINSQQQADRRASLTLELEQLKREYRFQLLAQTTGQVTNLQIRDDQYWYTVQPFVQIIPLYSDLYAELLIPSRWVGFIQPNMPVTLRFDAFPYQQYGVLEGRIDDISKSSLSSQEIASNRALAEPVYLVKTKLSGQFLQYQKQQLNLIEGMNVSAQIHIESRTMIDWILKPIKGFSS